VGQKTGAEGEREPWKRARDAAVNEAADAAALSTKCRLQSGVTYGEINIEP